MFSADGLATFVQTGALSPGEWRWAIFSMGIASILLATSVITVGIFLFRARITDRALFYFSLFIFLYSVRVFLRVPVFLLAFSISPVVAGHLNRAITFTIAFPILFLFLEVVQARWRRAILWMLGVQLVFAPIAILCDLLGVSRHAFDIVNSILVLANWVLLLLLLFFLRPPGRLPLELRVVAVGLVANGLFVLHANLVGLGFLPGRDVEPLGVLIFIFSLGYLVAYRVFKEEERLISIQKELEIAEQIQMAILPQVVPRISGVVIAARYLPMSAVAGDFYDFVPLPGNQLGVLIADVTGHGVPAALIASMLKVALGVQSPQAQFPERVLFGLNQALCGKFETHFVTAAFLYVDLDKKFLRYAGAGHPPLLFCDGSNGQARPIEQNGLILGMFPDAVYTSVELPLHSGDRLALYTDGLSEARNPFEEEFGIARCQQFLEAHRRLSPAALADQLLAEIANWSSRSSGRMQEDDMTLVVVDC